MINDLLPSFRIRRNKSCKSDVFRVAHGVIGPPESRGNVLEAVRGRVEAVEALEVDADAAVALLTVSEVVVVQNLATKLTMFR